MSSLDDLARKLRERTDHPRRGGKVVELHLFAIEHAGALENVSLPALLQRAGMHESYKTELRKGMNLAPFVRVTG
jgi:hypothetical protein